MSGGINAMVKNKSIMRREEQSCRLLNWGRFCEDRVWEEEQGLVCWYIKFEDASETSK